LACRKCPQVCRKVEVAYLNEVAPMNDHPGFPKNQLQILAVNETTLGAIEYIAITLYAAWVSMASNFD
jgi:hypothetical protein